jgi:hypothetical protein
MGKKDDINRIDIETADAEDEDGESAPWDVKFTGKARKQKEELPGDMKAALFTLKRELEWEGPEQTEWPHYGKLKGKKKGMEFYHCHLSNSKQSYVVIWKVADLEMQLMEIRYVGTHENADYRRIS